MCGAVGDGQPPAQAPTTRRQLPATHHAQQELAGGLGRDVLKHVRCGLAHERADGVRLARVGLACGRPRPHAAPNVRAQPPPHGRMDSQALHAPKAMMVPCTPARDESTIRRATPSHTCWLVALASNTQSNCHCCCCCCCCCCCPAPVVLLLLRSQVSRPLAASTDQATRSPPRRSCSSSGRTRTATKTFSSLPDILVGSPLELERSELHQTHWRKPKVAMTYVSVHAACPLLVAMGPLSCWPTAVCPLWWTRDRGARGHPHAVHRTAFQCGSFPADCRRSRPCDTLLLAKRGTTLVCSRAEGSSARTAWPLEARSLIGCAPARRGPPLAHPREVAPPRLSPAHRSKPTCSSWEQASRGAHWRTTCARSSRASRCARECGANATRLSATPA